MERSKDGVVSKAMALFQVVYFFQDYVRRWKRERSVIDLEIVTMIYIIINAFTFILYWHKPFYILLPTKVQLKPEPKKKNSGKRSSANSHPS
jgi:predicted membrane protein